jgi:hypothetical protein
MAKLTMKMAHEKEHHKHYKDVELTFEVPHDMSLHEYEDLFKAFLVALSFGMDNKEVVIQNTIEE